MDESVSLIIILILLMLSAFFSGSETSFFSLNSIDLKRMENEKEKNKYYKRIFRLLSKPKELLILILLGNTIVNVAASATATMIAINLFPHSHILVLFFEIIIMTSVILIFGEVIPKLIAISSPEKFAGKASIFLEILKFLLWPVVKLLDLISTIFSKKHKLDSDISVNDVKEILSSEDIENIIEDEGKKILFRIFRFNKTTAEEIMQPRVDIVAFDERDSLENLKKIIIESGFSKIPVYKDDIDNITGYVHAKDLILKPNATLKELIRKTLVIPENMPISELLKMFKKSKIHIAIVVDEYGGTSGMITVEDIFEEIVGEIEDEYDKDELPPITKMNENLYVINAMTSLTELNEEFSLDFPEDLYSNLAEFFMAEIEGFPKPNQSIIYKNKVKLTVKKLKPKRIISILLEILPVQNK